MRGEKRKNPAIVLDVQFRRKIGIAEAQHELYILNIEPSQTILALTNSSFPTGQVCKLQRSLYGLKQASRQCFARLPSFLLSAGYHHSIADHSLFLKFSDSTTTALLVYMDDIILASNNLSKIRRITHLLDLTFRIKDLGNLKFFLGLEVARSHSGIHLCQRKYTLDLLFDTGMLACKPASTPINYTARLHSASGVPLHDPSPYRRLVGRLIYLTTTRPDIAFAVQQLSQYMSAPTDVHLKAAFRTLRYLKQAPGSGLFFSSTSSFQLNAFSDLDWAGCPDTRRSITDFSVYLGHSFISWRSKKQATVSKSSSEAEYHALASTTCEIQWLTFLLENLSVPFLRPSLLFCDNDSVLQIASNEVFHERTKHIDINCHIIRDKTASGLIKLLPISSSMQLAHLFTKPLSPHLFHVSCSKLGILNIHSQLEGGSQQPS
ncbi:hypothetical protein VNO78_21739 [Psophocarpus tetragonolobus]|uniref:Reverse transcriptase Ty1/copia-type domain-containing protein n=1 Tax=Psophocarpus tetragonolobus TaxID=3891 RepID=A0AAN9SD74_PSOTE